MTTSNGPWSYDAESGLVLTKDMTGVWLGSTTGDSSAIVCQVESHDGISNGDLIAAAPTMQREMNRYLPVLERAEADPILWQQLTAGLGIATLNGYRAALAKAEA